jgi:hypothetical protein
LRIAGVSAFTVEGVTMEYIKKSDQEVQLALEEAELEYNEICTSARDTYLISWKLGQLRGELLRRKLKLYEKNVVDLVSLTQDSLQTMKQIREKWTLIKKNADQNTFQYFKTLEQFEIDMQTAIHLQINYST